MRGLPLLASVDDLNNHRLYIAQPEKTRDGPTKAGAPAGYGRVRHLEVASSFDYDICCRTLTAASIWRNSDLETSHTTARNLDFRSRRTGIRILSLCGH